MKLSTKSRYSVRILMSLARHADGQPLQIDRIARLEEIPVKYVEQLLRALKQAGFIRSVRGPKGGYHLALPPEQITVGRLVRLFETHPQLVECVARPENCQQVADCQVRRVWQEATDALYGALDAVTIADLACTGPATV